MGIKIAPSILPARFDRLGDQVKEAGEAGADLLPIDIMDGHFLPNLAMGPALEKSLPPITKEPFDTHLIGTRPQHVLTPFALAATNDLPLPMDGDHDVPV